jgi:uncharacterized membrane protein
MYKEALLSIVKRYNLRKMSDNDYIGYYYLVFEFKNFIVVKLLSQAVEECVLGVVSDPLRMEDICKMRDIIVINVCYGYFLLNHNGDYKEYSEDEHKELAYASCLEGLLTGCKTLHNV